MRLESGGWTRQVTVRELGISKNIAGVNMRLNAGGVRELHWHKAAEWAYMLYGSARITAIDAKRRNFIDDVGVGDLWYFPSGIPHSIQGLDPDGCEFLLVFDDGDFDEDNTFLISDWFKHTPNEALAKNFGVPASLFGHTPDPSELYIFPAPVPGPLGSDQIPGSTQVPERFSHRMTAQEPIRSKSGTVRITDTSVFPASKTIAAALVEVEPGGMRELHWHPNTDEWQYYIEGQARMGVFASSGQARTFDFLAGDVGYVPFAMGHYVENTGSTARRAGFLQCEQFDTDSLAVIRLGAWLSTNLGERCTKVSFRTETGVRHVSPFWSTERFTMSISSSAPTRSDITGSQPFIENRDAGTLARAIVDTVREPLLVLDKNLRVLAASRSFYQTFKVAPSSTQGQLFYALGNGQWDIPGLRLLLEKIVPEHGVMEDYEVEHEFPESARCC
jgi:oxalate decarboxylase